MDIVGSAAVTGATTRRRAIAVMIIAGVTVCLAASPPAAATPPPGPQLAVIAGNGSSAAPIPGTATNSPLDSPFGVAVDAAGNVYFADPANNEVDKVDAYGILSIFAGTGAAGPPIAGTATNSPLQSPYGVTADAAGNIYIADTGNNEIDKVDTSGNLSIVAGTGTGGTAIPGTATSSPLSLPSGVTTDAAGNIYIADTYNDVIDKVDTSGNLSIFAGTGTGGTASPGTATSSPLNLPSGVTADAAGNIYIADLANSVIDKVDTSGNLTIFAGTGAPGSPTPGTATNSLLDDPFGVVADAAGNIYIADTYNALIEKVTIPTVAGPPTAVTATAGDAGASLSWNAPISDGGSAVTSYQYSTDGGATWTALAYSGGGPFTATITGLSNGSTYPIQIRAVNAIGNGLASAIVSVTPVALPAPPAPPVSAPPTTPAPVSHAPVGPAPVTPKPKLPTRAIPPSHLHAVASDAQLDITFTPAVPAAGTRITVYQVSVNGGLSWKTTHTTGKTRLATTITGLRNGATYRVAVRALVSHGTNLTSASLLATLPKAWFVDPIKNRAGESPVPAAPSSYHGPLAATTSTYRSDNGTIAVPISWTHGRHLGAQKAATLTGAAVFEFDSPVITAAGTIELKRLVASLTGDKSITCEGYSDYGNQIAHEMALSLLRAQTVCAALTSFGAKAQMQAIGYGPTRPVIIGGTPADRAANRRVVTYIIA